VNQPAPSWHRRRIPGLGLSFAVNPAWALDEEVLDDGAVVSQRLPDDSVIFVRYGRRETLDRFLSALGDMLTTATIVGNESIWVAGFPARRVTVHLDRRSVPGASSEGTTLLRIASLVVGGVPVLVGYRTREDRAPETQATLEWIVESVDLDRGGDAVTSGERSPIA
jgi:hypothetical protein